ncbi:hypothetical protein JOD69_001609 [Methylocaldum sp. RMAD-M]|jgi:hypothetical protein|nr:hypothetical protein [Methylocaldum sp. RMAD-M]
MYETQVVFGKQDIWGRGVSIEPEADLYRVETALPHPLTANRKSPFLTRYVEVRILDKLPAGLFLHGMTPTNVIAPNRTSICSKPHGKTLC